MNDEKIINELQNRNETVIGYVISKYSKMLWTVAAAVLDGVGTSQDIEECVADTFIYLWEKPCRFNPERGKLKTWLSIVARTQAHNRCRSISKRSTLPLEDAILAEQIDIADDITDDGTKRALVAAVRMLKEPDREILIRRFYYDQKPREIALALCMSVKQVENRLFRTKMKLRKAVCQ